MKYSFKSVVTFCCCWTLLHFGSSYVCWIQVLYHICDLLMFSLTCGLFLHSSKKYLPKSVHLGRDYESGACQICSLLSFQIKGLCHKYAPWLAQETYRVSFLVFIGAGGTSSTVCLVSGIVQSVGTERISQKKLNPSDQCKFYSVNVDYSKLKKEGPDF